MTFSPTRPLHRFQSTPSARRATVVVGNCHVHVEQFQSTPSARRATFSRSYRSTYSQFQSTPSARRATVFIGIHRTGHGISIHALREEGDSPPDDVEMLPEISIHALREEGDATVHFRC